MKWALLFMSLGLGGCHADVERAYSYCAVGSVDKRPDALGGLWVATCTDGSFVVFSRIVHAGEGVFYSPYWEGNDTVTKYGYIHMTEPLP